MDISSFAKIAEYLKHPPAVSGEAGKLADKIAHLRQALAIAQRLAADGRLAAD